MANPSQEFTTIIGSDVVVKGEIHFESPAKVLGRIEGTITSKATVFVAEGSDCKANISAREVAVEGTVTGNLDVDGRVELKPGGSVIGDITAQRMTMAEGASVNGHFRVGLNGASTPGGTRTSPATSSAGGSAGSSAEIKPGAGQPQQVAAAKK